MLSSPGSVINNPQVVLMSGFNSVSHGSQDLFPTFLADQARMDDTMVTVITVVGQIGAIIGSTAIGYCSTFTGEYCFHDCSLLRPMIMDYVVIG